VTKNSQPTVTARGKEYPHLADTAISNSASEIVKSEEEPLFEGFGKGILRDYKARLPYYWSDVKDGVSTQCIAAVMFLFFACLAPAVGFGGLFGVVTKGSWSGVEHRWRRLLEQHTAY
jgi:hypothetical protein